MAVRDTSPRADFWYLWSGQVCSQLGSAITSFAIPLLIFKLTGSALDLALAGALGAIPAVLFGLPIGALVDRVNRKRLMIGVDLARALLVASIPLLEALQRLTIGWIYLAGFIGAALATCFAAAQTTAVVSLVPPARLVTANGRLQASFSTVGVIGPLLAGALVGLMPIGGLLYLDALTFGVSAISLLLIRGSFNQLAATPARIVPAIREGLAYLMRHPLLRLLALLGMLLNLVVATLGAQLVLFAKVRFLAADAQLGLLYSAQSLGVIGFALGAGLLRRYCSFSQIILGAIVLHGLLTVGLALSPRYWVSLVCLGLMAGLVALMGISVLSLRQALVPNQLLGRVSSSLAVLSGIAAPLGTLAGGYAIQRSGDVQLVFAAIGCLIITIGVGFIFTPLRASDQYLGSREAPPA